MSERCVITQRTLEDAEVTITPEGPVACDLWGKDEIKFNSVGEAIIPHHLEMVAKTVFGRDVDTGRE